MKNLSFILYCVTLYVALLTISCTGGSDTIRVSADTSIPQVAFALEEMESALAQKGYEVKVLQDWGGDVVVTIDNGLPGLKEEGFRIERSEAIEVTGADAAGAMYGLLELAEQINVYGMTGVKGGTHNPHMELRGTKFNIPLDVRTPSYTDPCDAAQENIPEMWSLEFWKEYIDNLARYRYNYISLWNLHPFPSMVRVPGFEDVALDDVHRSTVEWNEYYSLQGMGFCEPEILANPEIVKKITMDEKIEFWKEVMAYGKSRNIDFYVVTWNIFDYGIDGKYGIDDRAENPVTRDYFRKSVKQMFLSYPDLAGIGLTTGENMHDYDFTQKEDWAYNTYAMGMLDAAKQMPDRKFTFIHRQHMTGALDIAAKFKPLLEHDNIEFLFSFKYAKAHVMSATTQPYHENFIKDIEGMKTIWTLRNDDNYQYRWGAPDFVREFISNIPHDVTRGFYYGSDQWVWGREFLMKDAEKPRQIEIVKHWYHWMMWGRLGFDPELGNERFAGILEARFPGADGKKLMKAWQDASMIYPITTGFHWGPLDFQWYIESCKSRPDYAQNETGFHDVNRFINLPPHTRSGYQSIPDYVEMKMKGEGTDLLTPFEVSRMLDEHATRALESVAEMGAGDDRELAITLQDIKTMALLGKYYSLKISGSTNVALYRETGDVAYQEKSVQELTDALEAWKLYTAASLKHTKNPLWTNRVGYVEWENLTRWAAEDIAIAKGGL